MKKFFSFLLVAIIIFAMTLPAEWYQKALAIDEKVLGKDHPDTATTYDNTAGVYDDQGDNAKALEWYQKALDIREKKLGPDHPYTKQTKESIKLCLAKK